jgi:hypothetical protein
VKTSAFFILLLMALGFLVLGCQGSTDPAEAPTSGQSEVSSLAKGRVVESVTGHVEVPVAGIVEKYSFSAVKHADGTVNGEWQVLDKNLPSPFPSGLQRVHGNVTCFTIQPDGKTVWLAGVSEQNTWPGYPAGFEANWTVVDNGEGANAPADMATDLAFGSAPGDPGSGLNHCIFGTGYTNIPLTPIVRGNIQVGP